MNDTCTEIRVVAIAIRAGQLAMKCTRFSDVKVIATHGFSR